MFKSFFPRPGLFFGSAAVWALACVLLWFLAAQNWGPNLSLGGTFGAEYPAALPDIAVESAASGDEGEQAEADPEVEAARAAHAEATKFADEVWFYQFMAVCYLAFILFWLFFSPHRWSRWSVVGSALIFFVVWFQVHIDVLINDWFRSLYDLIQRALSEPNSITYADYYGVWIVFGKLAAISITVSVLNSFFVSHFVFRWRTAMNDYYMSKWEQCRHIEGASQRVQEDTMRFAGIMEGLGVRFVSSFMTLIAFLPILWGLSVYVKEIPILGAVPHALVWIAIGWSIFGTGIIALAGIRLPGLEFRNQRVEAAYRKELVLGEDYEDRAQPPTVGELFNNVRKNYFRLYWNYLYFNVFRYLYLQTGVMVPYMALAPTIVAGGFTLGIMQQTIRAFSKVEDSFQFLVNSWTTIVELMSIYKRLQAFEAAIHGRPLPQIDQDYLASEQQ